MPGTARHLRWLGLALLLASCQSPSPSHEAPSRTLVTRNGLVLQSQGSTLVMAGYSWTGLTPRQGRQYDPGGLFLPMEITPGGKVFLKRDGKLETVQVPLNPAPWVIQTVSHRASALSRANNIPDTALALAGDWLVAGTYDGMLHLTGLQHHANAAKPLVTGGMVKALAFAGSALADPDALYVGEQSPLARLHRLSLPGGTSQWTLDLATRFGEIPPADPKNPYGIYALPGIFQLLAEPDGGCLALLVYSKLEADGSKSNRSQLLRFDAAGTELWTWPPLDFAQVNLLRMAAAEDTILLAASRSLEAPFAPDWPDRLVIALDRTSGVERGRTVLPAHPDFPDVPFIWQAVGLTDDGQTGCVGLSDGRAFLLQMPKEVGQPEISIRATLDLGTPLAAGSLTITAPVVYGTCAGNICYLQTAGSNIPPGTSDAEAAPPAPHPGANTLTAVDASTGTVLWTYRHPAGLSGLVCSADGRWLAMGAGNPLYAAGSDTYGLLLFETARNGTGEDRLVWQHPLSGAPFFNLAMSPDGFAVAVTETPVRNPDGVTVKGAWQTHVVH